jgi:hypothetical protein
MFTNDDSVCKVDALWIQDPVSGRTPWWSRCNMTSVDKSETLHNTVLLIAYSLRSTLIDTLWPCICLGVYLLLRRFFGSWNQGSSCLVVMLAWWFWFCNFISCMLSCLPMMILSAKWMLCGFKTLFQGEPLDEADVMWHQSTNLRHCITLFCLVPNCLVVMLA